MPNSPAGFTQEQQAYLVEALKRLNLHQVLQGGGGATVQEDETIYGVPLEDLCREEVKKHELHPLDMWPQLEAWTASGHLAEGLDQFLLRHLGFFNVEPNSPGYMMRLRTPACVLRGDQMEVLAHIAENLAGGYAHVTTRGSLQMREIRPENVIEIIDTLQECGLTAQGTGADSARNLTASPTAGFDRAELIDISWCARKLAKRIIRHRALQGIPRKFNISYDNAGSISCLSDTNDIGFLAVDVQDNDQGVAPGIWCRIHLGGITGHKDFARDTGIICRPDHAVDVGEAMLRVFVDHGDRTNRKKARLKYLLDAKGFDWFVEKTREKISELGMSAELLLLDVRFDAPRPPIDRQGHIGVHAHSTQGLHYVGAALEVGRMSPEQMRRLAEIAQKYGRNEIRLTVWQNPLIPHVRDGHVAAVQAALDALNMPTRATAFAAGAVACTGRWGCKLAAAYTKQDATKLVRHLESCFMLDKPINIHFTGCANSCAQHYIGDIGLVGAAAPDGGEGYNIVLGGGSDLDQGLARPLCGPVAADDIYALLEHVVATYLDNRETDESFLAFVRRQDDDALRLLLPPQFAQAA